MPQCESIVLYTSVDCLALRLHASTATQPAITRSAATLDRTIIHRSEVTIILAITGRSKACLHEAAHAVTAVVMGLDVEGVVVTDPSDGETDIRQGDGHEAELVAVAIAGRTIERLLGRERALLWTSDWDAATLWASRLLGETQDRRAVDGVLEKASLLSRSVLSHAKPTVLSLARQLKKTGSAVGDDCRALLSMTPADELSALRADEAEYRKACAGLAVAPDPAGAARG